MGGVLASCAASCFGSVCGSCISQCCDCGENNKARYPYVFILFLASIGALCLRFWGGPLLVHLVVYDYALCTDACSGYQAVYRFSFALFALFALIFASLFFTRKLHSSMWLGKITFFLGALVAAFFIPNSFFNGWAEFCRYMSFIFLVVQIVALIDFSHGWNTEWVAKEYFKQILAVCAALLITSYTLAGYFFKWFAAGASCSTETFFIGFTFALTIAVTILALSPFSPHGALLPSAVVTAYCTFLLYSALASDPTECNSMLTTQSSQTLQLVIGIFLAAISVAKAAWDFSSSNVFGPSSSSQNEPVDLADPSPLTKSHVVDVTSRPNQSSSAEPASACIDDQASSKNKSRRYTDDESQVSARDTVEDTADQRKSNLLFHASMALSSLYLSMLFTNWGSTAASAAIDVGWPAVWVKIASQWLTVVLYAWTLVAPRLFPDRDFS